MIEHQPQQKHEMVLQSTDESGVEEWYCPTCGRRFLLRWPPHYNRVILERGDESAIHDGGKGGVKMQPPQLSQETDLAGTGGADPVEPIQVDESTLEPWLRWMGEVDFDSRWNQDYQ